MSAIQFTAAGLALIFTSALPRSWQQFSLFLMRAGLYSDQCPGQTWDNTLSEALCHEQDKKVADLLSIYMAAWSAGGVLAGPFMDHFGPRYTCALGEVVQILSMILLIFSNMNVAAVVTSLVLQGLFCNFILYTALMLADYHPHKASSITAFAGSALAFGSAVPPIILLIWTKNPHYSFKAIFGVYVGAIMLPLSIFLVLTAPMVRGGPLKMFCFRDSNEPSLVEMTAPEPLDVQDRDQKGTNLMTTSPSGFLTAPPSQKSFSVYSRPGTLRNNSGFRAGSQRLSKYGSTTTYRGPSKDMSVLASVGGSLVDRPRMPDKTQQTLFHSMLDMNYILILILSSLPCLAHIYYPAVLRDMSGEDISTFVGWGIMSQGVFCLIFGWLGDRWMSTDMMLLMNIFTTVLYICVLIPNHNLQYFTGSVWIIGNSYVFSPRYTACRIFCPPQHLGTMMGFAGAFLGAVELSNLPLARSTRYKICCYALLGLTVFLFFPTLLLRVRENKLKKQSPQWYTSRTFSDMGSFSVASPREASIRIQRVDSDDKSSIPDSPGRSEQQSLSNPNSGNLQIPIATPEAASIAPVGNIAKEREQADNTYSGNDDRSKQSLPNKGKAEAV